MGKLIFITGGSRSGKSRLAVELAGECGNNVVFLATGEPKDREMESRIKKHKQSRPAYWQTIEEPLDLSAALKKIPKKTSAVIVDCLTLLVSNLLLAGKKDIEKRFKEFIKSAGKAKFTTIIVSNELGSGIVPENKLARDFRDIAGIVNQAAARASDEAYYMVSGCKIKLK